MECAVVAEGLQKQLQRLGFHQEITRNIVDDDMGEIRLAGHRAKRCEFGRSEAHDIIGAGIAVRHFFEHGLFRALRRIDLRAQLRQAGNIRHGHGKLLFFKQSL